LTLSLDNHLQRDMLTARTVAAAPLREGGEE